MFFKIVILQFFLVSVYCVSQHPILIVVSYDAFGANFLHHKLVPTLEKLKKVGTYADYLINVFPTKTFPNHHSIATGLYPEVHGVIANKYFDPKTETFKSIDYDMYHYNEDIVPIWRWNEDQGEGRHSGSMMWPGGIYAYQGKNITYSKPFAMDYDYYKRVDEVISWIMDPIKPANLVMFYIEEPDSLLHIHGSNSEIVKNVIRKLDNVTKYLEEKLEQHELTDKVNVIHLSDHGIINVRPPNFINVTQYLTLGTYISGGTSPTMQIFPKKGHENEIYEALNKAAVSNGHFAVYKKEDLLKRWHYKNNTRTPPILVMANVGYALDDMIISSQNIAKKLNFTLTNSSEFGVHGYDPAVSEMHPMFMVRGPKIKKMHKVAPFETVNLYNLFCEILELPLRPTNGTIKDFNILTGNTYGVGTVVIIAVGAVFVVLFVISLVAAITLFLIKRQQNITTTAALNKRFPQTFQNNIIEAQHLLEPEDA